MNRADYLTNQDVSSFAAWLAEQLKDDAALGHQYEEARSGRRLSFDRLSDALINYEWKFELELPGSRTASGSTYSENCSALDKLRAGLQNALKKTPADTRDSTVNQTRDAAISELRDWAIAVVKWGGVSNGNKEWLQYNRYRLKAEFVNVREQLSNGTDSIRSMRFNSGMSKIYSLLSEDLIIYDSRVAAALAWLVAVWCRNTNRHSAPADLAFRCMPAKEAQTSRRRKIRNPSGCGIEFLNVNNRSGIHARWNIRASWILTKALELSCKENTTFHRQVNKMRALEAALFMWGYDLSESCPWMSRPRLATNAKALCSDRG